MEIPVSHRAGSLALLLCLASIFFFAGLGRPALSDPDEPYYAVTASEMQRDGSWLVPIFRSQPWLDKPILFYWMILAAYQVAGVSEWAARAGSALAATAGLLVVWWLGRLLHPDPRSGSLGAVILATSLGYALAARAAVTDMTLTVAICWGMACTARFLLTGRARHAALAGAAFGLAALAKGPIGLALPGAALLAYCIVARRAELLRPRAIVSLAAGTAAVAGPWYAYMAWRHPGLLFDAFLMRGNLGRLMVPEHESFHLYYPIVLAAALLPWSGLLAPSLLASLKGDASSERGGGRRPGRIFLACWFLGMLAVVAAAASKLPSYALPVFPPAALMISRFWIDEVAPRRGPTSAGGWRWMAVIPVGLAVAAATGAVVLVSARPPYRELTWAAWTAGAILVAAAAAIGVAVRRRSISVLLLSQVAASGALLWLILGVVVPSTEPLDSTRPLVRQLQERGVADQVFAAYKVDDVSLEFYLGRSILRTRDREELRREVRRNPGRIWIVRTSDLQAFSPTAGLERTDLVLGPHRSALRLSPPAGGAVRIDG
jgi:4-amino-4-deoxy-L-arabinose transferase-like glycosyltransferase